MEKGHRGKKITDNWLDSNTTENEESSNASQTECKQEMQ